MTDLSGFRDYNTTDGEEYWFATIAHTVEALHGELSSWPMTRALDPTTGEICEGRLADLLPMIVAGLREGHKLRLEPKGDTR